VPDDLFFPRPAHRPEDPEGIVHIDPLLERRLERNPWEVRSAQWRAWALAEEAFGEGVRTYLAGRGGYRPFQGLLTISVPFRTLQDHRHRESLFLAWASRDPVLTRVPFVFIFAPAPVEVP
jgi:hypothetical protein